MLDSVRFHDRFSRPPVESLELQFFKSRSVDVVSDDGTKRTLIMHDICRKGDCLKDQKLSANLLNLSVVLEMGNDAALQPVPKMIRCQDPAIMAEQFARFERSFNFAQQVNFQPVEVEETKVETPKSE